MRFLNDQLDSMGEQRTTADIQNLFREMKAETIRSNLKKLWLEDFYYFIEKLNDTTCEMMTELLKFEADMRSIQIVYNMLANKEYQNQEKMKKTRLQLLPNFGYLYYDMVKPLVDADSFEKLREAIKLTENYLEVLKDVPDPSKKEEMTFQS